MTLEKDNSVRLHNIERTVSGWASDYQTFTFDGDTVTWLSTRRERDKYGVTVFHAVRCCNVWELDICYPRGGGPHIRGVPAWREVSVERRGYNGEAVVET